MQFSDTRTRGTLWRKLFVALMLVVLAAPMMALPADAAGADRLTVRINSINGVAPKAGVAETVKGFVAVGFTINPKGQLGVPARRQDTPFRTFQLDYAAGAVGADGEYTTYRMDSWQYKGGINCANAFLGSGIGAGGRTFTVDHVTTSRACDRSTYVPPGVGSVRPPRSAGWTWDSTVLHDGPATLRLRAYATDGSLKDVFAWVNVQNKGSEPVYADFLAPKNGDTVSGWVGLAFTAMPQRLGIQRGDSAKWNSFLPTCFDIDINYWKVEYAQGLAPNDARVGGGASPTEYKVWAFSDYGYNGFRRFDPKDGIGGVGPSGCPGSPVFTYSANDKAFQTNWNSTVVPDGPATIRFTIVYNDGGLKQFTRVVNVENFGKPPVQYFGIDKAAITGPIKGDNWGVPGWADVPFVGVPRFAKEWPTAYHACDIAAGDSPSEGDFTMFWVSDNGTLDDIRDSNGFTVGGTTILKDWTHVRSYGRSGGLCRLDTTTVPNGIYSIRLRMQLSNGTQQVDWTTVEIKN